MKKICIRKNRPVPKVFYKLLLTMKISLILLFVTILQATATIYSQNVSVDIKNQTLRELFKAVESQSNYRFFYNDQLTALDKTITVKVKNSPVTDLLDKVLNNQSFSYKVLENNMVASLEY